MTAEKMTCILRYAVILERLAIYLLKVVRLHLMGIEANLLVTHDCLNYRLFSMLRATSGDWELVCLCP
jgi:hypothetical protein